MAQLPQGMTGACSARRDGCAVETAELAPRLRSYVARWNDEHHNARQHGTRKGTHGHFDGNDVCGAVTVIHERTRRASIDPSGHGIPKSTIRSVLSQQRRLTELRIADALLTATEQPFALHDGSVNVIPNPRARAADRAACCGSSGQASLASLLGVLAAD